MTRLRQAARKEQRASADGADRPLGGYLTVVGDVRRDRDRCRRAGLHPRPARLVAASFASPAVADLLQYARAYAEKAA